MKNLLQSVSSRIFTKINKNSIPDSRILKGIQCEKLYWLEKNHPGFAQLDTSTDILKKIIKDEVESKAKELFSDAYVIKKRSQKAAIEETKKAISNNTETILDAVFEYNGIVSKIDILQKDDEGYSFYEIKTGSGAKDVHFNETALKWHILKSCNIALSKAYIIYINNKYERSKKLDINNLFIKKNVTSVTRKRQEKIIKIIDDLLQLKKEEPAIDIGLWCNDPYECAFKPYCWKNIKSPSVFDLHKLPGKKKFDLYRDGILSFKDIPIDFELKDVQKRQIDAELNNKTFIDKKRVKAFVDSIHYPIYFLDFETFQQAIPKFESLRPYEQIPFQFSLHILKNPDAKPKHIEFLAIEGSDPRTEIALQLTKSLGNKGTILAYNQSFEKSVIKRLAEQNPQHSGVLLSFLDRFNDLMAPFEKGMYYTKEMQGSHSIKAVLPALVPQLSYKMLNIQHGGEAMNEYSLLLFKKNKKEIKKTKKSLLEYCKLDTLAMVMIWKKLKNCL